MPCNSSRIDIRTLTPLVVLIAFRAFFLPSSSALEAQSLSQQLFSQRIGNTIDSTERAYFNLFPGVFKFRSATVQRQQDTTIITITRHGVSDTSIGVSPRATQLLTTWIDEHESVYHENRDMNWPLLWKYTGPAQPFNVGIEATITDTSGTMFRGTILYADESLLYLWPIDSLYDWKSVDSLLLVFDARIISNIKTTDAYYYGLGAGIALGAISNYIISNQPESAATYLLAHVPTIGFPLLGGWIGKHLFGYNTTTDGGLASYQSIRSQLSRLSYFQRFPPELRNVAATTHSASAIRLMKFREAQKEKEKVGLPLEERLHIMATIGKRSGSVGRYEVNTVGRISDFEVRSGNELYCITARYNFIPMFGIGPIYIQNNHLSGDTAGTEFMNFSTYGICADAIAFSINLPVIRAISFGVGGGYGQMKIQGGGSVKCPFGYCDDQVDYSYDETRPVVFIHTGGDIYITDFLSVHYRNQHVITSSITVLEGREFVMNSTIGPVLRRKGGHTIDLTFFTSLLGIQIHL
jgi:hypothetical protein